MLIFTPKIKVYNVSNPFASEGYYKNGTNLIVKTDSPNNKIKIQIFRWKGDKAITHCAVDVAELFQTAEQRGRKYYLKKTREENYKHIKHSVFFCGGPSKNIFLLLNNIFLVKIQY